MPKILLDRSLISLACVFQHAQQSLPGYVNKLAGYTPTKVRDNDKELVEEQRGAILRLAREQKSGRVQLFTSRVLFDEGFRVARYPSLPVECDIFSNVGVDIDWVELPINVSKLHFVYEFAAQSENTYDLTFKWLLDEGNVRMLVRNRKKYSLTDRDVYHLENIGDFQRVAKVSQGSHIVDIFSLWTAHSNGIEYFSTYDKTFVRFMNETVRNPFSSTPIIPGDLCRALQLEFHPLKVPNDDFYVFAEKPLTHLINEQ
jgi:hypothetical protein